MSFRRRRFLGGWLGLALFATAAVSARVAVAPIDFGDRVFDTVGNADDIPHGVVTALAQDAAGFLWIGTQEGLVRFDGFRFRRFHHVDDDPQSLSGDFVFSLAVAADGRIWVGTETNGVSVLDPATEHFTRYTHDARGGIGPGNIYALAARPNGDVFVAAEDGLVRFDPARRQFEPLVLGSHRDEPEPSERVRSLLVARDGTLWIGSQDGVLRLRPGHRAVESMLTRGGEPLAGREVVSLLEARDGAIWVGTREHGAARLRPETGEIHWIGRHHPLGAELARSWINAMAQVSEGEIWLSRYGSGVALVDAASGEVRHVLSHDPTVSDGLSFDAAGAFWVDRGGLLWIGSWGGGLQRHNPNTVAMTVLRHGAAPGKLTYPNLLSVLERRDGTLLAGTTQRGIDIIDPARGVIGGFRADGTPGALPDGVIGGMAEADDATLWVGTFQGGIARLDPGTRRFRRYGREQGLRTLQIEFVELSRDGRVFAGTGDGLAVYDRAHDRFVEVMADDGSARTRFNDLAEDDDGRLWIGSANGLFVLDPGATTLRVHRHRDGDAASLAANDVASVLVDPHGRIWVNTTMGLDRAERAADGSTRFVHISPTIGMTGESFGSNLLADRRGRIWSQGAVFDPDTGALIRLHRSDGLAVGTNWVGAAATMRDGRLLFGGTEGLVIVDPERFAPHVARPEIVVTGVTVDGRARPQAAVSRQLVVAPGESQFGIEFSANDFSAPQSLQFAYRMDGVTDDWVAVDHDHRLAAFGGLWPGDYALQLRATARDGEVGPVAELHIRVLPKLWQQPGTQALAVLMLLTLLWALVRLIVARHRGRALTLQRQVDERTAALREAYATVERAARTDALTGLGNRRSVDAALPELLAQARATQPPRRLALLLIDIDEFKQVNDRHGHAAGDRVIEDIAAIIRGQLDSGELGVRWGGEEFLVALVVADEAEAMRRAESLRRTVARHAFEIGGGRQLSKTCSIGCACLPFAPESDSSLGWADVLDIADAALFDAKQAGRDRCCGYAADGALPRDFIDRFRAASPEQRRNLSIRRLTEPARDGGGHDRHEPPAPVPR